VAKKTAGKRFPAAVRMRREDYFFSPLHFSQISFFSAAFLQQGCWHLSAPPALSQQPPFLTSFGAANAGTAMRERATLASASYLMSFMLFWSFLRFWLG